MVKIKKWNQFSNQNYTASIPVTKLKNYVMKGVADYLYAYGLGKSIKSLIKYDIIPFDLLNKTEQYANFEKCLKKQYVSKKYFLSNVPIGDKLYDFNIIFDGFYRYYFFGVFGIISILGVNEVKKRIPYLSDLMVFLTDLPTLTGDYNTDLLLYKDFYIKMKDKSAPLKEVGLLIGTRFYEECIELQKLNKKELYGD